MNTFHAVLDQSSRIQALIAESSTASSLPLWSDTWSVPSNETTSQLNAFLYRPWANRSYLPKALEEKRNALGKLQERRRPRANTTDLTTALIGEWTAAPTAGVRSITSIDLESGDQIDTTLARTALSETYLAPVLRAIDREDIDQDQSRLVASLQMYLGNEVGHDVSSSLARAIRNLDRLGDSRIYLLADLLGRVSGGTVSGAALEYLAFMLRQNSRYTRDAAAVGLALLNNPAAVPFLRKAIRVETSCLLRATYEEVIEQID